MKDRSRTWPHYKVDRTPSELPQRGQALGIWGSERAGSQHPESGMWKIELCPQLFNSLMSKEEWANWQGRRANQIMVSGGSFSLDKRISIFMEERKKKKLISGYPTPKKLKKKKKALTPASSDMFL